MSLIFYCEEEENGREESINNYKGLFSIYENNMPNLSDALKQMFKSAKLNDEKVNELIKDILNKCRRTLVKLKSNIIIYQKMMPI